MKEQGKVTIFNLLKDVAAQFQAAGISTARVDAEVLLSTYLGKDRSRLIIESGSEVPQALIQGFEPWVLRRLKGEPVAYITGTKEFWSLEFEVNAAVLIPRPETEILVEEVLKLAEEETYRDGSLLELGTGSGAISVALASEMDHVRIFASDVSQGALNVATENARKNGVAGKIFFFCSHLFDGITRQFDFVVSNPPYVSNEEFRDLSGEIRNFEPRRALVAGPEGVEFHRELIHKGWRYLKDNGWLLMEIGYGQRQKIERMLRETKRYDYINFRSDYGGIDRVVIARKGS